MRFVTLSFLFLALGANPILGEAQEATTETESLVEATETLAAELEQLESELRELYQKAQEVEGEEKLVIEERMKRRGKKIRESLGPFRRQYSRATGAGPGRVQAGVSGGKAPRDRHPVPQERDRALSERISQLGS